MSGKHSKTISGVEQVVSIRLALLRLDTPFNIDVVIHYKSDDIS